MIVQLCDEKKSDVQARSKALGVVQKLRLQNKVDRWSKNVHFLSTFIP